MASFKCLQCAFDNLDILDNLDNLDKLSKAEDGEHAYMWTESSGVTHTFFLCNKCSRCRDPRNDERKLTDSELKAYLIQLQEERQQSKKKEEENFPCGPTCTEKVCFC